MTMTTAVPGSGKSGQGLLQNEPATVKVVADYVDNVLKQKRARPWAERRVTQRSYSWVFAGHPEVMAKYRGMPVLQPLPLERLLREGAAFGK